MKIVKHQVGGIVYTPYIKGQQAAKQAATSSGTTQEEKQENEIQKAIIKVLEENGLNNDTDYFLRQANKFLSAASSGSLFGKGDDYNLSDLIKLHSLANKIRNNKAEYDEAIKRVTDEHAGSDVAITNTGGLYVQDEDGKLRVITSKNYYENSDKYTLLTNADLLVLRKNSPELAYNMTILGDMTNAIGMTTIADHLRTTIKDFGTASADSSDQRYTIKDKGKIEKGFEAILGGVAPDGIYKITNTGKVSDQGYSTEEEMWAAAQYLWTTLDGNMKNVIKAQTVAEGGNPSDPKDVYRLLITALQMHTTHGVINERKVDYDTSASKASGFNTEPTKNTIPKSYLEMVATGDVTQQRQISLRSNTNKATIQYWAQPYPLLDKSGNQVKSKSLTDVLNSAQIGQIVDKNSITFGNRPISDAEMDMIIYDGTSQLHRAWLPYDKQAAQQGIYKPDFDVQDRFEEFQKWLKSGDHSEQMIRHKMQELKLNLVYNPETNTWIFNPNDIKAFLHLTGVSSHRAVDMDDNYKSSVSRDEGNKYYDMLESDTPFSEGIFGWWGDASSVYKSGIYMPILDASMATVGTNHALASKEAYLDMYNRINYMNESNDLITNF